MQNSRRGIALSKSPCDEGLQAINSWTAPVETVRPKQSITLEQGLGGHYFLESEVNGRELTFVIDTGATMVSLPNSIARAAEIDCQTTLLMETANGVTKACTATIAELKLGPFLMKDVPAVIVPNLLQPLLGMNILQRFNIAQEQSRMRISER